MDKGVCRRGIQDHEDDDQLFFNKIISRNSSFGCSSRINYYRSSDGIPFNWEMQPGTPKEPQKEDVLPPISPPPAVLSLRLPKPCINVEEPHKPSMMKLMRFKFWKQGKIKKNHGNKKLRAPAGSTKVENNLDGSDSNYHQSDYKYPNYEICSSDDGDFMASPPRVSSSSSSSTSFSFSNGLSFRSSSPPSRDSSLDRRHYGCSPLLGLSSVLVRVSRLRRL